MKKTYHVGDLLLVDLLLLVLCRLGRVHHHRAGGRAQRQVRVGAVRGRGGRQTVGEGALALAGPAHKDNG